MTSKGAPAKLRRKAPKAARPLAPKTVNELQGQLTELTTTMSELNGALRYEQKRLAAEERSAFYASIGDGVKAAAIGTGKAVVAVNKAMGGAIATAGKTVVESVAWLFTKKVEGEAGTEMAKAKA